MSELHRFFNKQTLLRLFTSIAFRISVSIAFVVTTTTIFVVWYILKEEKKVLESELKSKGLYLVRVISHQLIEPLLYEDRYAIYSILQSSIVEEKGIVVYAEVFDTKGESIVKINDENQVFKDVDILNLSEKVSPLITEKDKTFFYEFFSPIEAKGLGVIGYLRLCVTKNYLYAKIDDTRQKLYFIASLIVFFGVLAGLWMARKIIRPILILNHGVNKIKGGELGVEVAIVGEGEIKELSIAFNEMSRRLKEQAEEVKSAYEGLVRKEKLYVLGEFSACLAHEIKNPLTSIKMLIQSAKGKGTAMSLRDLEVIDEEIKRIDRIVNEFLAFARPSSSISRTTNVNIILSEVVMLVKPNIDKLGINLTEDYAEDLPLIMVNPDRIKQLFINIILNALQSMTSGGRLTIKTHFNSDTSNIVVAINDTGYGIAEQDIKRIFDPFFTTKEDGTGMGLAIAETIVKEHGGFIGVKSEVGKGTTFMIYLPAYESSLEEEGL